MRNNADLVKLVGIAVAPEHVQEVIHHFLYLRGLPTANKLATLKRQTFKPGP